MLLQLDESQQDLEADSETLPVICNKNLILYEREQEVTLTDQIYSPFIIMQVSKNL